MMFCRQQTGLSRGYFDQISHRINKFKAKIQKMYRLQSATNFFHIASPAFSA